MLNHNEYTVLNMRSRRIGFSVGKEAAISGTMFTPEHMEKPCPAVLFIHGWSSNESGYRPRAETLVKLGYVCLTFDLLGHGHSSGSMETVTLKENIEASAAAYDFIASQESVDKESISIVGTSYGAYMAAILPSKREVKSLVLRVPAIYADEHDGTAKGSKQSMHLASEKSRPRDNLALNSISGFGKSILLIEAEHDQVIPHYIIELIKKAAKPNSLEHVVVKGSDHQFSKPEWQEEFIALLTRWFGSKK